MRQLAAWLLPVLLLVLLPSCSTVARINETIERVSHVVGELQNVAQAVRAEVAAADKDGDGSLSTEEKAGLASGIVGVLFGFWRLYRKTEEAKAAARAEAEKVDDKRSRKAEELWREIDALKTQAQAQARAPA